MAFLDITPLSEGHLLVIPKDHYLTLSELPDEVCGQIGSALPTLGRALIQVTGADGFNLLQNNGPVAGQVVPHVHFHLIPRRHDDGLGYRWNAGKYAPGREADVISAFRNALA